MGFTWSLYFAQRINESQASLAPSLQCSELMRDRGPPVVFEAGQQGAKWHYVYVDNLGVMGDTRPAVGGALSELEDGFGSNGLDLHPGELFRGEAE
eukprot:11091660-Lingulodinium_polyedra.AAC.1